MRVPFQVGGCRLENGGVLAAVTEQRVASQAEKVPDLPGLMVMVHVQSCRRPLPAQSAGVLLSGEPLVVFVNRDAVSIAEALVLLAQFDVILRVVPARPI
jgi:hypothetical protein